MSSSDGLDGGKLIVVCGPTAAGKSALAMRLAEVLPITIVSADSRQIYRRFDIGTAKPTCQERDKVPHVGLDLVEPIHRFSSFAWATTAIDAIAQARAEGRVPVVVGGAGFYVRALVTPEPGMIRYDARYLVVDPGPVLREWIAHRVDTMLASGWREEVVRLERDVPDSAPAWQASGYTAVREMVRGNLSEHEAREAVVIATRQYAKRQRTWFRHQLPADQTTRMDPRSPDALARLEELVQ
ncbi:MAG TPA: tRNA (adenosine(37)-N6)-dimethylallyltransferase MiaA [Gemmatimonadaceae bacterium]|nr:tRNA (adenosine(37)-N6)-dimethylallyltransferase MiaA [Gemmatimonadaceae bacterium]